jgi:anaerobic magnesium-protoporphyrin IX monomethyl ester cyclase
MITSRGCPFKCIFCSRPALSKKVRFRSSQNVIEEIKLLRGMGYRNFNFLDDTFTIDMKRTRELCQAFLENNCGIKWVCVTRPDRVDESIIEIMGRAGCREIVFGVESGNEYIRNEIIKKDIYDYQVVHAIKWCKKYRITPTLFLMMGFPEEKRRELEQTGNYGLRVKADGIGVHLTVPMPGSEIFDYAVKEGTIDKDVVDLFIKGELGEGFRGVWPIYVPEGLSLKVLQKARDRAHRLFYFRPSYITRRFVRNLSCFRQFKADMRIALSLLRKGRTETAIS